MKLREKLDIRERHGLIGIEVEVEFAHGHEQEDVLASGCKGWSLDRDGSLRGPSLEFVLRQPCTIPKLNLYLNRLFECLDSKDIKNTGNCSVHVHINCQEMSSNELAKFITLYVILEQYLLTLCAPTRKSNLFCLSFLDAEDQYIQFDKICKGDPIISREGSKYAALNLSSLAAYGSLEFRALQFPVTKEELHSWITTLLKIRDYSLTFDTPSDILMRYSEVGLRDLVGIVLGTEESILISEETVRLCRDSTYRLQSSVFQPIIPFSNGYGNRDFGSGDLFEMVPDNLTTEIMQRILQGSADIIRLDRLLNVFAEQGQSDEFKLRYRSLYILHGTGGENILNEVSRTFTTPS